jgi:hypothetical protein
MASDMYSPWAAVYIKQNKAHHANPSHGLGAGCGNQSWSSGMQDTKAESNAHAPSITATRTARQLQAQACYACDLQLVQLPHGLIEADARNGPNDGNIWFGCRNLDALENIYRRADRMVVGRYAAGRVAWYLQAVAIERKSLVSLCSGVRGRSTQTTVSFHIIVCLQCS